jgi:hypothetical protein
MSTEELKEAAERAVEDLTAAEEHRKACEARRDETVRAYNDARLLDMGIVTRKTIIVTPDRYSWRTSSTLRVVAIQGSSRRIDHAIGQQVTSKNQIWKGRRSIAFAFDRIIEITDEEMVTDAV